MLVEKSPVSAAVRETDFLFDEFLEELVLPSGEEFLEELVGPSERQHGPGQTEFDHASRILM